jgi:hypothetical protein
VNAAATATTCGGRLTRSCPVNEPVVSAQAMVVAKVMLVITPRVFAANTALRQVFMISSRSKSDAGLAP